MALVSAEDEALLQTGDLEEYTGDFDDEIDEDALLADDDDYGVADISVAKVNVVSPVPRQSQEGLSSPPIEEDEEEEEVTEKRQSRSKFACESSNSNIKRTNTGFIPDTLDESKFALLQNSRGRGNFRGKRGFPNIMRGNYIGSVKLTPQIHRPLVPPGFPIGFGPPFGVPMFPRALGPPPMLGMPPPPFGLAPPSISTPRSNDWLRLTEEFLNKSKSKDRRSRSRSPERRLNIRENRCARPRKASPKPRIKDTKKASETTAESAKELGLDSEYLVKLEKQKEQRAEIQRQKEMKRQQDINKKQQQLGINTQVPPAVKKSAVEPRKPIRYRSRTRSRTRSPPRRRPRSRTRSRTPPRRKTEREREEGRNKDQIAASAWARKCELKNKESGGEHNATLDGRRVVLPSKSSRTTVHVPPMRHKPTVHVNPNFKPHLSLPPPLMNVPTAQVHHFSPVTVAAVVRNATPSLTPQRMKIVAGTMGLVKSVTVLSEGILSIVFFDPIHAATFCQTYNGKVMDNRPLQVALEPYTEA